VQVRGDRGPHRLRIARSGEVGAEVSPKALSRPDDLFRAPEPSQSLHALWPRSGGGARLELLVPARRATCAASSAAEGSRRTSSAKITCTSESTALIWRPPPGSGCDDLVMTACGSGAASRPRSLPEVAGEPPCPPDGPRAKGSG